MRTLFLAPRKGLRILVLACLVLLPDLLLTGCAGKQAQPAVSHPGPAGPCTPLYTYAPGFLIVDLAAGSDVFLDPAVRPFPVFCTPQEARSQLVRMVSAGRLPRGDWQIYALDGGYEALGRAVGRDSFELARQARLAEWIPEQRP